MGPRFSRVRRLLASGTQQSQQRPGAVLTEPEWETPGERTEQKKTVMHRAGLSPAASPAPLQGTGKHGRNQEIWGTAFADPPCGPHSDEIISIDLPKAGLFIVFNIQSYARDPGRKSVTSSRSEQGSSRGREGTRAQRQGPMAEHLHGIAPQESSGLETWITGSDRGRTAGAPGHPAPHRQARGSESTPR